jgi:hypothetical protein
VIEFRHKTNRETTILSYKTALVVQALKTLGQNENYKPIISKLAKQLTKEEKNIMLNEAKFVTDWVYEIIKKICEVKQ